MTTDHGTWTVLDRVKPGTALYEADPGTLSLEALFRPLAAMRDQPPPRADMPSILEWLRDRLQDDHLADLRPGTTVAPADEREAALNLLADLASGHTPGLCHADASMGNLIASGTDRWTLMDPRGMTGESAYDVAVLAMRAARLHSSIDLLHIAKQADVAAERVRMWMTIASAARV